MSKGTTFTSSELDAIKSFIKDKMSYADIAFLIGRSKDDVVAAVSQYGLGEEASVSSEQTLFSDTSTTAPEEEESIEQKNEKKPVKTAPAASPVSKVKEKTLLDFQPRDMISCLYYKYEYRIINGQLCAPVCEPAFFKNFNHA